MTRSRSARIVLKLAFALLVLAALAAALPARSQAPAASQAGDEQVWKDFLAWYKAAPNDPGAAFEAYAAELGRQGLAKEEIGRRLEVIKGLFATRTEAVEIAYDKTYRRTPTGKPWEDGFASVPSEFLVSAVKDLTPGRALDVGMGQGRNAVELARRGWDVTGFDISGEAIAAAARNAEAAGVPLRGIKADYASFDFGRDAWDLVLMMFAWAPVDDPAFAARVKDSLRPGGAVVFEHFVSTPERPYSPMIHALRPGALKEIFAGFEIVSYEELTGTGDWGGPGSRLVRMVARKR